MDKFIQRAITEHKELIGRIYRLSNLLDTAGEDNKISKQEYSLMYHQFEIMNDYAATLEARLNMHGIEITNGKYYEDVTDIAVENKIKSCDKLKDEQKQ